MSDKNLIAECSVSFVSAISGKNGTDGQNGADGKDGKSALQYTLSVTGTRYSDSGTARSSYSVNGGEAVSNITTGGRGLTVLVFNTDGTEVVSARQTFDTYGDSDMSAALVVKLQGLHDKNKVIAVVSMDAAVISATLQAELRNFGGSDDYTTPLPKSTQNTRVSFAFVGQYGMLPHTAYYSHSSNQNTTIFTSVNAGVLIPRGDRGDDGAKGQGISSADVVFGNSDSDTTAPDDSVFIATVATDLVAELNTYLWQAVKITYTDNTIEYTGKQCLGSWNDIKTGSELYTVSDSGTVAPILPGSSISANWNSYAIPTAGKYLWSCTQVIFDSGAIHYTTPVCIGYYGENGTTVTAQYSSVDGTADSNWHDTFRVGDVWMRTSSDSGKTWSTAMRIVGEKGTDGAWTDYTFCLGDSLTTPPTNGTWVDSPLATTATLPYLWMKVQKYSDATTKDGNASYVRLTGEKGEKGDPGEKGEQGLQGCILRTSEWAEGVEYRNDEKLTTWPRYLDVVVQEAPNTTAGYLAWYCDTTHTSTADSRPQTNAAGEAAIDGGNWRAMNSLAPIFTPLIIAKNALLKFAQTNQLLVMKEDGVTVNAAMGGGTWPLWVGGDTALQAPFAVDMWGNVKSGTTVIPATNGGNKYIVEDKSGIVFTPSSDNTNPTFDIHLPIDSEYIGKRLTIILQPQSYSSGVYQGNATLNITAGDVFVNCVYGQGTSAPTAIISEVANSSGAPDVDALSGMQYFGGGYVTQGTTNGMPSKITISNSGRVELLGIEEDARNVWRAAVGKIISRSTSTNYKPDITRDENGLIDDENSTGECIETTDEAQDWKQDGDGYTRVCRWVVITHTNAQFS